ncbi:MAG TPA: linear amide C-N hydrolase [Pyrinomonadaceae bacterium]|jgi:choloylglycine hydrolase|nr:linear amide C-N hydrolase [Pyrinomonadaceae bacterium]
MKIICKIALSFLVVISLFNAEIFACTTFCLKNKGEVLFGKNYDWMIGDGMVFVNKRGIEKSALVSGNETAARWISKYGNVTFNQYGRDNPSGGMNEAGLVIELMWLEETQYPKTDARPVVDVLEWIQYQLDTSANVGEVIKNSEAVRIASPVKLHYLVNDKAGNSATIEFLDGKLVAHTGENLAAATLTNDTYEKSLNYSKATTPEKAKTESSLDRFTRAAGKTKEFAQKPKTEQEAVNYAFEILSNVAQKNSTQWSIVYDQTRGKIHFRSMQSPAIKTIETKSFDYSCANAVKIFDVNSKEAGDVTTKFADYTRAANRDLIERSFSGTPFLKVVSSASRDELAQFPENFVCEGVQASRKPQLATAQNTQPEHGFLYHALEYVGKLIGVV